MTDSLVNFDILAKPRFPNFFGKNDSSPYLLFTLAACLMLPPLFFAVTGQYGVNNHFLKVSGIGFLFLILGVGLSIYFKKIKKNISGKIVFNQEGITVHVNNTLSRWSWDTIRRLDIYLYYGVPIRLQNSILTVIHHGKQHDSTFLKTEILHIRISVEGAFHSFYVFNTSPPSKRRGVLYLHLFELKKTSLKLHRKIQFWTKRKYVP